uniref:KIND domain-containing protein n=1 Tax=Gouania willdenowi TaxID=441366 RepID=A0A8C5DM38_GOUWI
MLTSPTHLQHFTADVNMDCGDGAEEVSLEELLSMYGQPINEEQAWAVCYQCCRTLAQKHRRRGSRSSGNYPRRIEGLGDVKIGRDGTVRLQFEDNSGKRTSFWSSDVCVF